MTQAAAKINLLNYNYQQMRDFFTNIGEKPFRAQQVMQWMHQEGLADFSAMTNLGKSLRTRLSEIAEIRLPQLISEQKSNDGTCKWLLKLDCANCIETVYIPEARRGTLCVSSQVGCSLNCSFCSTGKQGFNRNLDTFEIIGQLWFAVRALSKQKGAHDRHITNVVMMGMGEPLLNFDNVVTAMDIMMDDFAYGLSKKRVTLSTSGIIPELIKLQQISPVALAVSLHAPNDALRDVLVPINKKYPLKELMALCKNYYRNEPKRKITFEYVMLDGVNDQAEHAKQLAKLLNNIPAKVNLIPFNPFPHTEYQRSERAIIEKFQKILLEEGMHISAVTIRKTRGDDIDAACGQLAGEVNDRTSRSARWQKMHFVEAKHLPYDPSRGSDCTSLK